MPLPKMTHLVRDPDGWVVEEKRPRARQVGQRETEMWELKKKVSTEVPTDGPYRPAVSVTRTTHLTPSTHVRVVRDPKNRQF